MLKLVYSGPGRRGGPPLASPVRVHPPGPSGPWPPLWAALGLRHPPTSMQHVRALASAVGWMPNARLSALFGPGVAHVMHVIWRRLAVI